MKFNAILLVIGRALDPKRDFVEAAPRPLLLAKNFVEYMFKISGFFVLLCLIVGMTLASCPTNPVLAVFPFVMGTAFCFYLALTSLGLPVFLMISEIENTKLRRLLGYMTVLIVLAGTVYTLLESPIFDLLEAYVGRLFPEAYSCRTGPIQLGD